ncbi:MAG: chemotaxis protein CheW [Desulfococcaceae bacterium]
MELDESVLKEFIDETLKNLETAEIHLSHLARAEMPADEKRIREVRRGIHSIKGCAGFFPLPDVEKLAGDMEALLDAVLEKRCKTVSAVWENLSDGVRMLRFMLENTDKTDGYSIDQLCGAITELIGTSEAETALPAPAVADMPGNEEDIEIRFEISPMTIRKLPAMHEYLYVLEYDLAEYAFREGKTPVALIRELMSVGMIVDAEIRSFGKDLDDSLQEGLFWYIVLYSTILSMDFIDAAVGLPLDRIFPADREKLGDTDLITYRIRSKTLSMSTSPAASEKTQAEQDLYPESDLSDHRAENRYAPHPETAFMQEFSADADIEPAFGIRGEAEDFPADAESGRDWAGNRHAVRIDSEKLDHLVNLVGELIIAESMVTKNPDLKGLRLDRFERSAHNLRRIISEVQNTSMSVRMFSLAELFSRMVRMVRDIAAKQGKQIQVKLEGEETETDRTVIEQIADPLLHIIRYAVLYGIELPEERKAAGKSETALITLKARHEGGYILTAVSDNGRGLNREEILKQAVRMGTVQGDGTRLTYEEICRLIFEPALYESGESGIFSVRNAFFPLMKSGMEKIKGRAEVHSVPGEGTVFTLRIPVTLTIIDGMLIRIASTLLTVPLLSIRESFRTETAQITVTMSGQELIRIRDHLLPVIRLHRIYGIVPEHEKLEQGILIGVVSGEKKVCLFADEIIGHHQTVVRRMPEYIGTVSGISGCTILENGGVGFILDVGELVDMTEVQEDD